MNEKVNNESGDILPDDFTGMDDGLAGSSEDAYDGDYIYAFFVKYLLIKFQKLYFSTYHKIALPGNLLVEVRPVPVQIFNEQFKSKPIQKENHER